MERTEQVISIASEHGIAFLMPQATFLRGWALAGAGRREAISDMREAMSLLSPGSPMVHKLDTTLEELGRHLALDS